MPLINILLALCLALAACSHSAPQPAEAVSPLAASGGINAPGQRDKPTLILISIDGFRWDYPDLFETPAIDRLIAAGVRADALVPAFPTLTFPNHFSIATGLYPANHGIVANVFPARDRKSWYRYKQRHTVQDGRWYGGEPIWVAAERHGLVSAAYFFVGTEANVGGVQASYWRPFDQHVPGEQRVDQVLRWLSMPEASRPHMVTLYFEDVDVASHAHGPMSPQNRQAVRRVDAYLERLVQGIAEMAIADHTYFVLVSDHGQSTYTDPEQPFVLSDHVDLSGISVVDGGMYSFLFFDRPEPQRAASIRDEINRNWDYGKAWLRDEAPPAWHIAPESRFPDIIVLADPRHGVLSEWPRNHETVGDHGWSPSFADMHGIFIASGPRLPEGRRIGKVNGVDIYPLLLAILGLPPNGAIDGDPDKLAGLLL